jgi:hypothetical protein
MLPFRQARIYSDKHLRDWADLLVVVYRLYRPSTQRCLRIRLPIAFRECVLPKDVSSGGLSRICSGGGTCLYDCKTIAKVLDKYLLEQVIGLMQDFIIGAAHATTLIFAGVAQLVEQRIRNAKVVGSNPISGTMLLIL